MCKSWGGWSGIGWQDWYWPLLSCGVTLEAFDMIVFPRICPLLDGAADTA